MTAAYQSADDARKGARRAGDPSQQSEGAERSAFIDKALVIGDDTRSFLSIARSLGRKGVEVHAAPINFLAPALKSKYVSKIHRIPYYVGDGADWLAAVRRLIEEERFSLIIPCDDRSLLPFHWHRDEFAAKTTVAMPDARSVEILFDKVKTRELADACGIAVSNGRVLSPDDTPARLLAEFGPPLAVKPRSSFVKRNLYVRSNVVIAKEESDLERALATLNPERHFIEGYFPGDGVGLSVLAGKGRLLQAFEHHRVHEPPQGGGSSYRKSAPIDPDLWDACERMTRALKYTGLAMFEFKKNFDTGDWILLEVNARPWGSIPLPLSVGVDFPYTMYRLFVYGEEAPFYEYRTGVYCRNLLQDYHCLVDWAGSLRRKPVALSLLIGRTVLEFCRIFIGAEKSDTFVLDDLRPAFTETNRFIAGKRRRLIQRLFPNNRRGRKQARARLAAIAAQPDALSIAVVCLGNICRSPFAEKLLMRETPARAAGAEVVSYGMMPLPGRPSPDDAIAAAGKYDVDLAPHRSRLFDESAAEASDLVVVFDERTEEEVIQRHPRLATRVVKLGDIGARAAAVADIDDPWGHGPAAFDACYAKIAADIAGLAGALGQSKTD